MKIENVIAIFGNILRGIENANLVPHNGLLNSGERLEGRKEAVNVLLTTDKRGERAELLREGQQHLVLIVDCVRQKRDQLRPRPFDAES